MSNDKNIENFDSFFQDAFNSFEPTPPQGVFEAIQSHVGVAGSSGAAAGVTTAAKAGAWGVGKIVIGAVAAIAIATTVYIAVPSEKANISETNRPNAIVQTENTSEGLSNTPSITESTNSTEEALGALANDETDKSNSEDKVQNDVASAEIGGIQTSTSQDAQTNDVADNGGDETSPTQNSSLPTNTDNVEVDEPKGNKTVVGIYLSDRHLCANERLTVTIADDLKQYKYRVDFGDGASSLTLKGKPTTHNYANSGKYKVKAVALNGNKETIEQWIEVRDTKAQFEVVNNNNATFNFINKSKNAVHFTWFFGDESQISQEVSPTHTFKSFTPKSYKVKLIAVDNVGCLDSFSTYVKQNYTYEDMKPKMYNVFSPGIDGRNDHFEIEINNEEKFHLIILDKSGNKIFESNDKNNKWDGRNMFTGNNCPAANYVAVFTYKIKGFKEQHEKKFVTLVR